MHETTPPPAVNITALHASIKTALRAQFNTTLVPTIDFYARQGERVPAPAIFFELSGITPADNDDVGSEQWNADLEFSAYVLVAYNAADAKVAVRALAASVAAFVRGQKFGQPIRGARVEGAFPDMFHADSLQGNGKNLAYETWRVDWTHRALIGLSPTLPPEFIPSEVYLGISPNVGIPHEPDYQRIQPPPPV